MTARQIVITHAGKDYAGEIMRISSTHLGWDNHAGVFTADLVLSGNGSGVTLGGYALDGKQDPDTKQRVPTAYGMDYIAQVLRTVGVDEWEDLQVCQVIALYDAGTTIIGRRIRGIAHLTEDRVFIPELHAEAWKEKGWGL